MRKATLLLLFSLSIGVAAAQTAPRAREPGDAPAFEMTEAVARARAHARSKKIDLRRHYLQSASFDTVKRRWSMVWVIPMAKGGMTEIAVSETGQIDVSYGE